MDRREFRLLDPLRVRWSEVDSQQIVFNAHYLTYFDTAMGAYWRALAMPYHATMAALGGDLYLRKATVDYLASARYDERLSVGLRCSRIGTSSIGFLGCAFRGRQALVTCELVYVYADPKTQTARAVPPVLRQAIEAFEDGKPMVRIQLGDWATLGGPSHPIRRQVFIDEQQVPPELEWDDADALPDTLHAVAYNLLGAALGTGRLLAHARGVAKIGRMAVARNARGNGIGRAILDALLTAARQRGAGQALLHAQLTAAPFYAAAGFIERGERFEEAGIGHIEMIKPL